MESHEVISYPLMTESASLMVEKDNKLIFIVNLKAGKSDVKKAVEELFIPLGYCHRKKSTKRNQILDRSLKTGSSGASPICLLCLPHQMPDQVISQQVTPEFFTNHLRAFAPQDIHLHGNYYVSEIKLKHPPLKV